MARASTKAERTEDILPEPVVETVTYVPRNPTDPAKVEWAGFVFHANVPKELRGDANGSERDRLNLHIIERARENDHFQVGDQKPRRNRPAEPKTPEEYRAHIAEWIKDAGQPESDIQSVNDMITKFAREAPLQRACGVGTDDWSMIGELFMPKLHTLQKMEEMSDGHLSSIWVNHGIMQLPW